MEICEKVKMIQGKKADLKVEHIKCSLLYLRMV